LVCLADREAGLRVIDVSDPTRPQEIGSFEVPGAARGVAISQQWAYIAEQQDLSSPFSKGRLRVIDLSDPRRPQQVAAINTPETAWSVTVAGNVAYVAHLMEGLRIIDVNDPTQPQELAVVQFSPRDSNGGAFGIEVESGIAYVANAPIRAIDVSDPKNPQQIGSVSSPLTPYVLAVVGDKLYAAAGFSGLLTYRVRS